MTPPSQISPGSSDRGAAGDGIVRLDRSSLSLLGEIIRDPLSAIPAACTTDRMVLTRNMGRIRAYLSDPVLVHEALVAKADCLVKSDSTKRVLGVALGDGLLTADGSTWRWQRQAIASAFQPSSLASIVPAMIAVAEQTRDQLLARAGGPAVDIGDATMRATFTIISDTMLSGLGARESSRLSTALDDLLQAAPWMFALAIAKVPRWVPFPRRRKAMAAAAFMRAMVEAHIRQRRHEPPRDESAGNLIDLLLTAKDPVSGRGLDDEHLTDNILTFFLAGHETTAIALAWTLGLLAEQPAVCARLRAEIDRTVGAGRIEPAHLDALPFCKQVVSEAMRLFPPAPIIVRAVERTITIGGIELPAGSLIIVPIYAIHHHEVLWPEPDRFDPDRFAPEAVRARHRFAFLPFGAGPRVCVGNSFALLEAVAILAVLVRALDVEAVEPLPRPTMRITLRPNTPIRLRIRPREGAQTNRPSAPEAA